jgi:hypothetical protein
LVRAELVVTEGAVVVTATTERLGVENMLLDFNEKGREHAAGGANMIFDLPLSSISPTVCTALLTAAHSTMGMIFEEVMHMQ